MDLGDSSVGDSRNLNVEGKGMRKILIGCLLFLACVGMPAQSLLEYYDSEFVTVNYQNFGGFSFVHGGVAYSAVFGLQQPLRDIIASNARTAPLVEKHVKNMRTGWICYASGLLAILGATYLVTAIPSDLTYERLVRRYGLVIGLSGGGTIFSIAGLLFMNSGYSSLFSAVNIYNRDKIRQYE